MRRGVFISPKQRESPYTDIGYADEFLGLKWGPLPSKEVGRVAQHIREGEIKESGRFLVLSLNL